MAPKADAKGAKKKEESEETSSEEEESYEYETESSSEKPAAKKADEKKPAAAADAKKPEAAKAAAKKEESEEESDEEDSDEYEYETESEESEKKAAAKPAAAGAAKPAAAAAAAPAKADDKKAAAKKEESEEEEDEDEYEYESEYETESEEKKPAAAAGAKPAAAAAPAKADDKKPAAAAAAPAKADDKKAAAPAAAATAAKPAAAAAPAAAATAAPASREVVVQEHKDPTTAKEHIAMFLGELFGTFFLSYVIFQFRLQTFGVGYQEPTGGIISHALVQAFAVGAVTAAFGHLSQAQFNPAVTLAMVALRQTKPLFGLAFVVLQVAGAVLAGLLAWGLAPPATQYVLNGTNATALLTYGTGYAAPYACSFEPAAIGHSDLTAQCWKQGFGGEIIGSFIFIMVYLLTFVAGHGEVGWLATAAALAIAVFSFHNTSNAYFNPARAIGGAVFTFNYAWANFWIYIIGPFIGSIMAILIFGFIFQAKGDKSRGESIIRH